MAAPSLVRNTQVVSLLSKRQFLVQWNSNPESNIVSYNIYRSEAQLSGFAVVGSVSTPSTQFVDTVPFTFGVNFYWKVTAVDSNGNESDVNATESVSDITIGDFDEEPFKQVMVQKMDLITGEIPMGIQNSINATYTTLFPFRGGSLQLMRNGLVQTEAGLHPDYTELANGTGFTVSIPPAPTDVLRVNYTKFFS